MTRPDWCPQRIWDEAKRTLGGHLYGNVSSDEAVARAILSAEQREREACALVADEEERTRLANMRSADAGSTEWGNPQEAALAQGHKAITAKSIATAIRNRGTDND